MARKRKTGTKGNAGKARAQPAAPRRTGKATAESMAASQREISVSEFFAKNRHLLGFDNPRKALLTTVKEAVDNALDACEEAGILPELRIEIQPVDDAEDRFRVIVQDNGPGIVRKQIENIFGKLLYGSKFHRLKMSRGQQGIGISAAGMYGLITTGKPVLIISKTSKRKPAHEVVLKMDTSKNRADVVSETEHPEDDRFFPQGHGTRVKIELHAKYLKGSRSVDEYVQLTAIANPHARITYVSPPTAALPEGETIEYERTVRELPDHPEEIKPHPHGVELGTLIGMLERTSASQLGGFFREEFCRVGPKIAQQVTAAAGLTTRTWVRQVDHAGAERLYKALQEARVLGPPTNCLSPIGVKTMLKGLEQGLEPDFITASSRPPAVYRGRPFIIEAGIAYGGNLGAEEPARVYRFANRVPLQYQQSACSSFKAVVETSWRNYGLQQPRGALPAGPLVIMVHMASVWVPFTSESKEAIADYDEIRREMRLALQECGRKLGTYLRKRQRMKREGERRNVFLRYIGEIARACEGLAGADARQVYDALMRTAERKTADFDRQLDEEGRFVDGETRALASDEAVVIRAPSRGEPGPDADGDDMPATLFGDDPEAAAPKRKAARAKSGKKKVVRKKVRKKVARKRRRSE